MKDLFYSPFLGVILAFIFIGNKAEASDPMFAAANYLIEQFQEDLPSVGAKANKAAIVSVSLSDGMSPELKPYLLKQLGAAAARSGNTNKAAKDGKGTEPFRFVQCRECFLIRGETDGDTIVVKKGVVDRKELAKMAASLNVPAYAEISFVHTGVQAILSITLYQVDSEIAIWGNTYEVRVSSLDQSGLMFSFSALQGFSGSGYPYGVGLYVAEKIPHFGNIGIRAGYLNGQSLYKSLLSVGPECQWNLSGPSKISSLYMTGGFAWAWYGGDRNILFDLGLKLEVGSRFFVSAEGIKGISFPGSTSGKSSELNAAPITPLLGFGLDF